MKKKKNEKSRCPHFKRQTCMIIKLKVPERQILDYCKGLYLTCDYYSKEI